MEVKVSIHTMTIARKFVESKDDLVSLLMNRENWPNDYSSRKKAYQLEELIIKFNSRCRAKEEQFERQQYHRWQRMNHLIITKVCNGLPVTQAERIQCCSSLMLAEVYTY